MKPTLSPSQSRQTEKKELDMSKVGFITAVLFAALAVNAGSSQAQSPAAVQKSPDRKALPFFFGTGPNLPVIGAGTVGQLTVWTGFNGSNSVIGDSVITQTKFGQIGIGTTTPTSTLTVQGIIETTMGGVKFPDGSVQTTAGLSSIFHDGTLAGNGSSSSPLGISPGGVGTLQLANGGVTSAKIAPFTVVRSLNGLFDNITIAAGANILVNSSNNTLTISAPNSLTGVAHDTTLTGDGSTGSPLGVGVPLNLVGAVDRGTGHASVIKGVNTANAGTGVIGEGGIGVGSGDFGSGSGGTGVVGTGGMGAASIGGTGVFAEGGSCPSSNCGGGEGLESVGGDGTSDGGSGVLAEGGRGNSGDGGRGVFAAGGTGSGPGARGGTGLIAEGGSGVNGGTNGLAGEFSGDVSINGKLNVTGTKNFRIDHPLDPENKYLYHAAIESSEALNIYSGNITTDQRGEAVVLLPEWFEAVNRDFRYQLTVIGSFAQAIVSEEIRANRFIIRTSAPEVKVSWQVTGTRSDPELLQHPFKVEEEKSKDERGYYLNPDAYGQPEDRGIDWARNRVLMQRMKDRRGQMEAKDLKEQTRNQ